MGRAYKFSNGYDTDGGKDLFDPPSRALPRNWKWVKTLNGGDVEYCWIYDRGNFRCWRYVLY